MGMRSLLLSLALGLSSFAYADVNGTTDMSDGRMKVQFHINKDQSHGSFYLRSILEQAGFRNENGFVRTGDALAPLELYNYLYENGHYVFTIFLPVDSKAFVAYSDNGFVSFYGLGAKKLFDLVKQYLPRVDVNNLEQYRWQDGNYCDKTVNEEPAHYRCWVNV